MKAMNLGWVHGLHQSAPNVARWLTLTIQPVGLPDIGLAGLGLTDGMSRITVTAAVDNPACVCECADTPATRVSR